MGEDTMSEYWKSQPKKFCQYCKCWIADNKPSVEFHERGKNHKENVAAKIAEMQKKSIDKAKQEDRQSKEFATMEAAALKAYEEDMKRLGIKPSDSPSQTKAQTPSPVPSHSPSQPSPQSRKQEKKQKPGKERMPRNESENWVEGKTSEGLSYYFNSMTGESRWDKPYGLQGKSPPSPQPGQTEISLGCAWMEAVSPDGFTYYYNTETGESSWERPADLPAGGESGSGPSGETVGPPGVDDPSAPQPEPLSGEDSSNSAKGAGEGEDSKQVTKKNNTPPSDKEGEDEDGDDGNDDGGKGEGAKDTPAAVPEEKERPTVKKTRKTNPYGAWEQIQEEEEPYENVDLQLPQVEGAASAPAPTELPPEPKPKFRERIITSLGDEGGPASGAGATFRKRKAENGKSSRSLRQRGDDD
ncbi:hypothetical protein J4Q44_G00047360 [Coregonus suidteri]|uniref:WW domain-binding protein 4 n=2 Tax=Coregonus TaxID=27772 RepID=A0AAN8M9G8_9TELE